MRYYSACAVHLQHATSSRLDGALAAYSLTLLYGLVKLESAGYSAECITDTSHRPAVAPYV